MVETILSLVSTIGTVATAGNAFVDLLQKTKNLLSKAEAEPEVLQPSAEISHHWTPPMQPFQPRMADRFGGGGQWLPGLRNLAWQFGNPWVATQTQGFLGVSLTGIWVPPTLPSDQTYIRQFGPYLNIIAGIGGTPTVFAEGLFDPTHAIIHAIGRNFAGVPLEIHGQLLPNWTIQGVLLGMGPFNQPVQMGYVMMKIA